MGGVKGEEPRGCHSRSQPAGRSSRVSGEGRNQAAGAGLYSPKRSSLSDQNPVIGESTYQLNNKCECRSTQLCSSSPHCQTENKAKEPGRLPSS